ncbi:MAG: permease [Candidatus Caldatribacteriaceae bacterium]
MFRKPKKKEAIYLLPIVAFYLVGVLYTYTHDFSMEALFKYGLLQSKGVAGEEARLVEIEIPLSLDIVQVLRFIVIKGIAVLVELFQYWVTGMVIATALVVFVPWGRVREKFGYSGFGSNLIATVAGSVIPICSCSIVPVLAGMIQAGIPLGPTMAFLIAAPMLNVPAVFMTAGILGWKLAMGRILGTFFIALSVGGVLSRWQKRERFLRRFVKLAVTPNLPPELQQLAFKVGMALSRNPSELPIERLVPPEEKGKLYNPTVVEACLHVFRRTFGFLRPRRSFPVDGGFDVHRDGDTAAQGFPHGLPSWVFVLSWLMELCSALGCEGLSTPTRGSYGEAWPCS